MVSSRKSMGMDKLRKEVERFLRPASKPLRAPKKESDPSSSNQEVSLKEKWKKNEERKKAMIERKVEEEEGQPEKEELERDEHGKVFKPHQRYDKGGKKKNSKKNNKKNKRNVVKAK